MFITQETEVTSTKNSFNKAIYTLFGIIIFMLGILIGITYSIATYNISEPQLVASEQWGGATPMKIYTVFDRDTGVYYAVTEKGGICVMETMSGETKLVDQGDGAIIHKNQGE